MRDTPRSQGTAGDARPVLHPFRPGRALAHESGASGSGTPHRSDGRPPHTPRGVRYPGPRGRLGIIPPVPRRPVSPPGAGRPSARRPVQAVLCLLLFALLTWQVATHGALRTLDERWGLALSAGVVPAPVAQFFADLGNTTVALPVLLAAVAWTLRPAVRAARRARAPGRDAATGPHGAPGTAEGSPEAGGHGGSARGASGRSGGGPVRWWVPGLAAVCTMLLVPAVVVPVKAWIGRPGPPRMAGAPHDGFFPSGHAATAAVAYGLVALLLLHTRRRSGGARRGRARGAVVLAVCVVLLNVGVGVGLVRQGYHWPLDVAASWCLSGVLLTLWSAGRARWYGAGGVGRS